MLFGINNHMPKISELATGTVTSAGKIAVAQGSTTIQASVADIGAAAGGGGIPVKGTSTSGNGFGLPGELTGIRIEFDDTSSNNVSTNGSITIQYNDSTGTARAFKLIGAGRDDNGGSTSNPAAVTAGSANDTSD